MRTGTGQVIEREGKRGRTSFGLRFRAYGQRQYVTAEGRTRAEAETELANILADVRRGIWQPKDPEPITMPSGEPTFHVLASEWLYRRQHEVSARSVEDWRWH